MNPKRIYYDNGQLGHEEWRVDGKRHRLDGPAYQEWCEDGQLDFEGWWVNGLKCEPKDLPVDTPPNKGIYI